MLIFLPWCQFSFRGVGCRVVVSSVQLGCIGFLIGWVVDGILVIPLDIVSAARALVWTTRRTHPSK